MRRRTGRTCWYRDRLSHGGDARAQPLALEARAALAELYLARGEPTQALRASLDAEGGNQERYGATHPDTLHARELRIRALIDLRRREEALPLAAALLEARLGKLGDDHPETMAAKHLFSSLAEC